MPGSVQLQIVGTGQSNLAWLPYGNGDGGATSPSTPVLRLHAPSHVAIRDLAVFGEPDIHSPNPLGEGLVAEVTDLPTMAPSLVVHPITDVPSTDIRLEHVWTAGMKKNLDLQFVLRGAAAQ